MKTVSFIVKAQDIREHLIAVHGHDRVMYTALSEPALTQLHDLNHRDGHNQMIEHTHDLVKNTPFLAPAAPVHKPREYGFALEYRGPNPLPPGAKETFLLSLKRNYEHWRKEVLELPEWRDEFIRTMDPTPAHEVLPCEHGTDEDGFPLYDECPEYGEDCEGYTIGPIIEGVFDHHIGWYVNLDD